MKNSKRYFYSISSFLLLSPFFVSAQELVIPEGSMPRGTIIEILQNLMLWLMAVVSILAVIGFAISGILYLTSAGDEERTKRAKRAFINSIVGIIVAMLGVVVMRAAKALLSGSSSTF